MMAGTNLTPEMRLLQDRFDTRRLADRVHDLAFHETLTEKDHDFIRNAMFFFLATVDSSGQPQCSYKGGAKGFVTAEDDRTLVYPEFEGNGLYLSAGNVAEMGKVGLLFIDFEQQKRMRVNGVAELVDDHPAHRGMKSAQLTVRVRIDDIHPNCLRNVHKMKLIEASKFTPQSKSEDVGKAPWPDSFEDVLPEAMKPSHMKNETD
jgi:predicted pyridoxine 5'-phosphate oxidase superfamily flavin-nucleotide-binding protein